jgi:hypothetical protein
VPSSWRTRTVLALSRSPGSVPAGADRTLARADHEKTERIEFATLEKLCDVLECEVGEILERVPDKKRGRP